MNLNLNWAEVRTAARDLSGRWVGSPITHIYGVPRGGLHPMNWVADDLGLEVLAHLDDVPRHQVLVVDDLIDSGATAARYEGGPFDALYRKTVSPEGPQITLDGWLVFPWEHGEETGPTDAVVRLLQHIGEDPTREGLLDTPKRVVKAFSEMTSGYSLDPAEILGTTFDIGDCDELVVVSGIEFTSLCEHHMLPFTGTASVGYLPAARVVGLSKLARLVDLYAQRLQVQERMTTQIAQAIMDHLDARAAGVIIRGAHSCMSCRGVRKTSTMTTSAMFGELRDNPVMRTEFMGLER